jgi:hypothetical protein
MDHDSRTHSWPPPFATSAAAAAAAALDALFLIEADALDRDSDQSTNSRDWTSAFAATSQPLHESPPTRIDTTVDWTTQQRNSQAAIYQLELAMTCTEACASPPEDPPPPNRAAADVGASIGTVSGPPVAQTNSKRKATSSSSSSRSVSRVKSPLQGASASSHKRQLVTASATLETKPPPAHASSSPRSKATTAQQPSLPVPPPVPHNGSAAAQIPLPHYYNGNNLQPHQLWHNSSSLTHAAAAAAQAALAANRANSNAEHKLATPSATSSSSSSDSSSLPPNHAVEGAAASCGYPHALLSNPTRSLLPASAAHLNSSLAYEAVAALWGAAPPMLPQQQSSPGPTPPLPQPPHDYHHHLVHTNSKYNNSNVPPPPPPPLYFQSAATTAPMPGAPLMDSGFLHHGHHQYPPYLPSPPTNPIPSQSPHHPSPQQQLWHNAAQHPEPSTPTLPLARADPTFRCAVSNPGTVGTPSTAGASTDRLHPTRPMGAPANTTTPTRHLPSPTPARVSPLHGNAAASTANNDLAYATKVYVLVQILHHNPSNSRRVSSSTTPGTRLPDNKCTVESMVCGVYLSIEEAERWLEVKRSQTVVVVSETADGRQVLHVDDDEGTVQTVLQIHELRLGLAPM